MLGSFASIVNMSVKNIWSVGVFVLVLFVIIGTSILHEKKAMKRDYQVAVEPYDVIKNKMRGLKLRKIETTDGKNSRIDDFEIKATPTFIRIPPHRMWHVVGIHSPRDREYRSIVERETDKGIDGGNLSYKGTVERNATEVSKDAKKSYKKLKLIRTRADYKKEWKNKEQLTYSNGDKSIGVTKKTIGRRQANYFANTSEDRVINRSKRCAMHARNLKDQDKSDYYSMRKAVMDKFYARQKEIAKKYAKKVTTITTTPKYISYNLREKFNKDTSSAKIETNDIQNVSAKIPTNNTQNVFSFAKIETNNVQKLDKTLDEGRENFDENAILISTIPPMTKRRKQVIETTTISNAYHDHLNDKVDSKSNESVSKSVSTNMNIQQTSIIFALQNT